MDIITAFNSKLLGNRCTKGISKLTIFNEIKSTLNVCRIITSWNIVTWIIKKSALWWRSALFSIRCQGTNLFMKIRINCHTSWRLCWRRHHCKKFPAISSSMSSVRRTFWIPFWAFVEMKVFHARICFPTFVCKLNYTVSVVCKPPNDSETHIFNGKKSANTCLNTYLIYFARS